MANFKTHLIVATTMSGMASISLLTLQLAKPWETGSYFLLGILGGLLPDIDSDKSTPLTMIFYFLSMYCAFAMIFNLAMQYSFAELLIIWAAIYFAIRHLVYRMFISMTIHRGTFHSLLAVAFMAMLAVSISFHLLHNTPRIAWNSGIFVGIGYLVHLTLDELYSVDLHNKRMKKSFGTALKLFSRENWGASTLMVIVLAVFIHFSPPIKSYWQIFNSALAKQDFQKKWLPTGNRWFADILDYSLESAKPIKALKKK
ncbi:metal-dependent hydrolase [Crenothrix sp.]|uniref:metal-dependent hydrolase n=1 Tax=Crenothrix sp. TaxID=3100433 RepID=UPI00374CDBF8